MDIKKILEKDLHKAYKLYEEHTQGKESFQWYREKYQASPELFIGCYRQNEIVGAVFGYSIGEEEQGKVLLKHIIVKEEDRGKGIGENLLKKFEEKARERNQTKIILGAFKNAEAFYLKYGYSPKYINVSVRKGKLPNDYRNKGYEILYESEGETYKSFNIPVDGYKPKEKKQIREEFNASSTQFVMEKEVKKNQQHQPPTIIFL